MMLLVAAVAAGVLVGLGAGYWLARRDVKRRFPYPLSMDEATKEGRTRCAACGGAGWYNLTGAL